MSGNTVEGLMTAIRLGIDTEAFLLSPVGKYLIERAKDEVVSAFEEFKQVRADKCIEIQHLQNRIWRAESFEGWLYELVNAGKEAEQQIKQIEEA